MTRALEEVLEEVPKLPEAEQDALAEAIRAEIGTKGTRPVSIPRQSRGLYARWPLKGA